MSGPTIDRYALVTRHDVVLDGPDVRSPLSVGNGEFCFTADITGLQTFPDRYPVEARGGGTPATLLGTVSQWGWHTVPSPEPVPPVLDEVLVEYESPRGPVPYVDMTGTIGDSGENTATEAERWLRANPHRLHLGRIGLEFIGADGRPEVVALEELTEVRQELRLWEAVIISRFEVHGTAVEVETVGHPDDDAVAVRITSPALRTGRLAVAFTFAYGAEQWHGNEDWSRPGAHRTEVRRSEVGWRVDRTLDDATYSLDLHATPRAELTVTGPHRLRLRTDDDRLEFVARFAAGEPGPAPAPRFDQVRAASAQHWSDFWSEGGAVELAESTDGRAAELERRVVLSQYLTAINCAGSMPPQETGLVCNSWFGRFHLEMHWWHAAHFPLWGRGSALEKSLGWYQKAAETGRKTAARQGFAGVRWPKQIGPDARESPSPIGPFLIWQQPHPIYLAELLYRQSGERRILEAYADLVFETAVFMADFAVATPRGFELGPPLVPAQESYGRMRARVTNPAFELAYWGWGLRTAQLWRQRLGLDAEPGWTAVADGLVPPHVRDGVYTAIDVEPYTIRTDHPSMLGALGVLPAGPSIDPEIMRATLHDVLADWDWESTWGWDYPVIAMCAARLGEPELAVDALSMDVGKNHYLASGHNWQTSSLPLYLPGNGGLLAAVALMAAGWDGGPPGPAPGFPADGRWKVTAEGLTPSP